MKDTDKEPLIRAFLFACTDKSEAECFERPLFGTDKVYATIVTRVRRGDLLFLNNLDTNTLYGVFKAVSDGGVNIEPEVWNGKYPYQVKVESLGEKIALKNARKILRRFKIKRNTQIFSREPID